MRFSARSPEDQARNQVRIQNTPVPIDRTILFTYQDGVVHPIASLTLRAPDGSQEIVRFPIAAALRAAGIPTIANVSVPAQ